VDPELVSQVKRECLGRLCIRRNGLSYKPRRFVVTEGFGPDHNLGVCNNNVDVMYKALIERYFLCKEGSSFRPALTVEPKSYATHHLKDFRAAVLKTMPRLPRLTRQQVVDCYNGPKRRVYSAAAESLSRESLNVKDSYLTAFTKFGKQDVSKAGRNINPRSPRYNLELGRFLKHAEHHFFTAINKAFGGCTNATVIKGFNADVSAHILHQKWLRFDEPVAIGLDASKFDMHVSRTALQYEHSFYKGMFPGSHTLKQLLRWQLLNRGVAYAADGSVKFEMHGTRSSGDLNTSLGNCIIMCSLIWAFAHERKIEIELANNGDDCVVFMEKCKLAKFMHKLDKWFVKMGFSMTIEQPVYEFEEVEFCQTRPVQLGSGWRMLRAHHAVLTKDPMCLVPLANNKAYRCWLASVGECGSIASGGSPCQQAFYNAFLRNGSKASAGMINTIYRNESMLQKIRDVTRNTVVTPIARVSYYYAYGILPDSQIAIERYFENIKIKNYVVSPPLRREDLQLVGCILD